MALGQGVIVGTEDDLFAIGYVFGTISGEATDDIPHGEIQDFSLSDAITLREVMGSTKTGAVSVGHGASAISGTSKWLKVRLRQFVMYRGGNLTGTGPTVYSRGVNQSPKAFNLHHMSPNKLAPDTELECFNCVAPTLNVPLANRDFSQPDVTWNCYGNDTNYYELTRPGDQTVS